MQDALLEMLAGFGSEDFQEGGQSLFAAAPGELQRPLKGVKDVFMSFWPHRGPRSPCCS